MLCHRQLQHTACRAYVNLYLFADAQNERAWVLQAPRHVWNNNVSPSRKILTLHLYRETQRHRMIGAVQFKDTVDLHAGVSLKGELT